MLVYPSLLPSPPLLCPSPWFPHRPLCLWPPPLSLLPSRCPASASLSSLLRPWSTAPRPPSPRYSAPDEAAPLYSAPSAPKETVVEAVPVFTVPITAASEVVEVRSDPIAIVRSVYHPPAHTAVFDYSYETANGIKQEAVGTLRNVDNSQVSVMKGSYSYVGADGQVYTVDWYADETGFHPTAPHFPKSVVPNHPEVAAAVRAQIDFAAKEDAAAASNVVEVRAPALAYGAPAPEPLPSYAPEP